MITEDYVSFETAKLLKEKGFDEDCLKYYIEGRKYIRDLSDEDWPHRLKNSKAKENVVTVPTLQMAMKWLRKVHNLHIWVEPNHDKEGLYNAHVKVGWWSNNWAGIGYNTHEKATEAAIKYCLENLI